MFKNVYNSKLYNRDSIRWSVFLLATCLCYLVVIFFGFTAENDYEERIYSYFKSNGEPSNNVLKNNGSASDVSLKLIHRSAELAIIFADDTIPRRCKRAAIRPPSPDTNDNNSFFVNDTKPNDSEARYKLGGWVLNDRMLQRLDVFITRKFEDFISKYYDPKGFHGQETHPIYGKFGTRLLTKEPITHTYPYDKLITKIWTRPANHTFIFSTKYSFANETLPPLNTNTHPKLHGWPLDERNMKLLEVFLTRKFEDFISRYYDPKGFHGQETHPIYGKYGTRMMTKEPWTRTEPYNKLITKIWTRPPNHTWKFSVRTFGENDVKSELQWADEVADRPRIPRKKPRNTTASPLFGTLTNLFGWPVNERIYNRIEVFITRKFEDFMSRYYDPKGYHGQETHPIYGKFGTRLITREPITHTHPYDKLITKVWTRPPNHTFIFSTKYSFTNETLPPLNTNTHPKLYGWPLDERNIKLLEVFLTRKFEDFISRYYDPKGFHGQETHPIYGKYGTRLMTREPWTRTDPYNNLITKVWTRSPNHTWAFAMNKFTTPEFGYYDDSEIDERVLKEYEEDKKKKV